MTKLTQKQRELLELIDASPPMSIYRLAKLCGRNYRRVHDHVKQLASAGLVELRAEIRNGRRVWIVESVYAARLRRLDEMHAFGEAIRAARGGRTEAARPSGTG